MKSKEGFVTKRSESRRDLVDPCLCAEVSIVWVNNLLSEYGLPAPGHGSLRGMVLWGLLLLQVQNWNNELCLCFQLSLSNEYVYLQKFPGKEETLNESKKSEFYPDLEFVSPNKK